MARHKRPALIIIRNKVILTMLKKKSYIFRSVERHSTPVIRKKREKRNNISRNQRIRFGEVYRLPKKPFTLFLF